MFFSEREIVLTDMSCKRDNGILNKFVTMPAYVVHVSWLKAFLLCIIYVTWLEARMSSLIPYMYMSYYTDKSG